MRLILIMLTLIAAPAFGEVYKWTDANGSVHFGSQPPPGEQEQITIRESKTGSMAPERQYESDILRQERKLQLRKAQEASDNRARRYSQQASDLRDESPDYICQGAENRLQRAQERWQSLKRQGYTISEEQRYVQRIRDAERHRDNICR